MRPPALLLCVALAGCASAEAARDEWPPTGPLTHEQASLVCWQKSEANQRGISLEKRADVVSACIAETLKRQGAR